MAPAAAFLVLLAGMGGLLRSQRCTSLSLLVTQQREMQLLVGCGVFNHVLCSCFPTSLR